MFDAGTLAFALVGGLALIVILAVVLLVVVLRTTRGAAEMRARLELIAQGQDSKSAHFDQRLIDHERAITKSLDEVGRRVGRSLESSGEKAQATMSDLRERLTRIDAAQKNITELSSQVVGLQDILSNKQARGAFGEFQLNNLVADVLAPDAYDFEVTLSNGRRVDCLVRLPNPPGPVAIDAKFPLEGYMAMAEARDETAAKEARRAFTAAITKHIGDIAERYIIPGETADAALMFLPSEAVYIEIQSKFRKLVEDAHRARVYIVSPSTLWAALTTMRAVFRDVRLREQTHEIQAELDKMLKDIGLLDERVGNLQRHHDQSGEDLRLIRISNDKIAKRAGQIRELEFEDDAPAAEIAPARKHLREV